MAGGEKAVGAHCFEGFFVIGSPCGNGDAFKGIPEPSQKASAENHGLPQGAEAFSRFRTISKNRLPHGGPSGVCLSLWKEFKRAGPQGLPEM